MLSKNIKYKSYAFKSSIISDVQIQAKLMHLIKKSKGSKIIFKGSRDGYKSKVF